MAGKSGGYLNSTCVRVKVPNGLFNARLLKPHSIMVIDIDMLQYIHTSCQSAGEIGYRLESHTIMEDTEGL